MNHDYIHQVLNHSKFVRSKHHDKSTIRCLKFDLNTVKAFGYDDGIQVRRKKKQI